MTAGDQAAATVDPDDGRSLARFIARQALVASRRRRAAGDRREFDARAEQVRRAATPDKPNRVAAATSDVTDADDAEDSAHPAPQPGPSHD